MIGSRWRTVQPGAGPRTSMNNLIRIGLDRRRTADLAYAKSLLENPGLAARLANLMGSPIEKALNCCPKAGWRPCKASHAALESFTLRC